MLKFKARIQLLAPDVSRNTLKFFNDIPRNLLPFGGKHQPWITENLLCMYKLRKEDFVGMEKQAAYQRICSIQESFKDLAESNMDKKCEDLQRSICILIYLIEVKDHIRLVLFPLYASYAPLPDPTYKPRFKKSATLSSLLYK
jgi:hypothetical protein